MSSKDTTKYSELNRKQNKALWKAAEIGKLLDFLKRHDTHLTESKWTRKGKTFLQGRCRFESHLGKDENPSLVVNVDKGYAKCHACGGFTDSLPKVLSMIAGNSFPEAVKALQSHFDAKIFTGKDIKNAEAYEERQDLKNKLAVIWNDELVSAIDAYRGGSIQDTEWHFAQPIVEMIEKRNPLFLDCAEQLPIGVFTSNHRIGVVGSSHGYSAKDIEGMKDYVRGYMKEYWLGAVTFVNHASPNEIGRIRLRLPDTIEADGSSTKVMGAIGDEDHEDIGLFGLGMSAGAIVAMDKEPKALLVEGEFDMLEIAVNQMLNNDPMVVPLSHGGAGTHSLDPLLQTNISEVFYVQDKDHGGTANAKEILQENPKLNIKVFNWPLSLNLPGDGSVDPFDCIQHHGYASFRKEIKEFAANFAKKSMWALEQVKLICAPLDIDDDDDLVTIKKTVEDYSSCVGNIKDSEDQPIVTKWISSILTTLGADNSVVAEVTTAATTSDCPEMEFLLFLTFTIKERYAFVAIDDKTKCAVLWDKARRSVFNLQTGNDGAMKTELGNALGVLAAWVPAMVPGGIPDFVKFTDAACKNPRSLVAQEDLLNAHLRMAIRSILPDLRPLDTFEVYTDGCHWLKTANGERMFCVNGNHVYMGSFDVNKAIKWEELNTPTYETYYFDLSKPAWSVEIKSIGDLESGVPVDLRAILDRNIDMLDTGWRFHSQETETMILAAFATLSTVVKIFPTNLQFLAANERSCGKSALYAEYFGGGKGTNINVVEHTQYVDNITPAGMRQAMDGSSRILIVDEFDNQKGSRGTQEKQEEVMLMLRTASTGQGVFVQGTSSGKPREYRFSVSTMLAGIDPEMSEANQTRLITTDLQSGLISLLPPQASILQKYPEQELQATRRWITLGVFKYIPQIKESYEKIKKELQADEAKLGSNIMQRFKDSLVILLAVMDAAGYDWVEWGTKICAAKADKLKKLNAATSNDDLVNDLLAGDMNITDGGIGKSTTSLMLLLSDPGTAADPTTINESNTGVWLQSVFDDKDPKAPHQYYLLVHWRRVLATLLRWKRKWHTNPGNLKTIADRFKFAIPQEKIEEICSTYKGIPSWMVGEDSVSAFNVTTWVDEASSRQIEFHSNANSDAQLNQLPAHGETPQTYLNC